MRCRTNDRDASLNYVMPRAPSGQRSARSLPRAERSGAGPPLRLSHVSGLTGPLQPLLQGPPPSGASICRAALTRTRTLLAASTQHRRVRFSPLSALPHWRTALSLTTYCAGRHESRPHVLEDKPYQRERGEHAAVQDDFVPEGAPLDHAQNIIREAKRLRHVEHLALHALE